MGISVAALEEIDRALVNRLQDGIPVERRPFAGIAADLGLTETEVADRVRALVDGGVLSRFGPMFDAERLGGGLTLAALAVPEDDFDRIAAIVNAFPEVAHNYARQHALNMWFVVATEAPERVRAVLDAIQEATALPVHDFPKLAEYTLDLRFRA
ncbi:MULTISPECIES: Lrp/AsnC family transcriptional regulator [Azospirillum]|uniref:siroheme decarboxylase n=1 Tax=Azospirillum brasilense TaxID=192 RepID=A0ABU4PFV0_AZOBR|nr:MULTISPECIES: AsnC family transcriptional regulator [Azospirillum]MDX5955932.1 AsnC family transcriptional regulator [Azospirillum brasilense]